MITTFDVFRSVLNSFAEEILTVGDMIARFLEVRMMLPIRTNVVDEDEVAMPR